MKTKTIIITIVSLVVVAIVTAIILICRRKNETISSDAESSRVIPAKYTDDSFPLKLYSGGTNVKNLQEKLNAKGASLEVDGKFGEKTLAALRLYTNKETISELEFKNL